MEQGDFQAAPPMAACTKTVLTTSTSASNSDPQHVFDGSGSSRHLEGNSRGTTCGLASGNQRRTSTKFCGGTVLVQEVKGLRNLVDDTSQVQVEAAEDCFVDGGDDVVFEEEAHGRATRLRSTIRCNTKDSELV